MERRTRIRRASESTSSTFNPVSSPKRSDGADALDRVLVSLCSAVDVIARSLHKALQLPGSDRNAKFHGEGWYEKKFRPTYEDANGIAILDRMQVKPKRVV